jgi:hypothetical protein
VRLDFEEVTVLEDIRIPLRGLAGGGVIAVEKVTPDLPGQAGGGDDQPSRVSLEHLTIDAWAMVEPLRVAEGRELHEVPVPFAIACEEDEVVVGAVARSAPASISAISRRHIRFHPDDRFELLAASELLKLPRAEETSMVGESQLGHLEMEGALDQIAESIGSIEEGELGVGVKMYEGHG